MKKVLLVFWLAMLVALNCRAQSNEIPHVSSWIGNTWGGGDKWFQIHIDDMHVRADGHCLTNSTWDEAHSERGEYFYENGEWNVIPHSLAEGENISSDTITISGIKWQIDGSGAVSGGGNTVSGIVKAAAVGVFRPKNYLMIADDAPGQHVVKFYDVSGVPTLIKTLGVVGGIGAGTPGVVTPTKFWGLTGCGSDAAGNVFVSLSERGVVLRRFAVTDANNLVFDEVNIEEAFGLHFSDNSDADPLTNGRDLYCRQEHYVMDYTKPVGQQWMLAGYSLDKDKYPNDPRLFNDQTSIQIKYKNGKRFMFSFDQNVNGVNIYKFDGEIAVHFLKVNEPLWVDDNCDLWFEGDGINVMRCTGMDGDGNLTYGSKAKFCDFPAPFLKVKNVLFDSEHDVMYLGGGTAEFRSEGGAHMGPVICKYINWSTTRDKAWEVKVPWYHSEAPVPDRIVPESWDLAGERLYVGYAVKDGEPSIKDAPGPIRVYNTKNGKFMGRLNAGEEVEFEASWIDVTHGVTAFEKSNGEHLVIREENWKAKNIFYLYCPEGTCDPTTVRRVTLNKVTDGNLFMSDATVEFTADVEMESGAASKVELYANDQLMGSDVAAPYTFSISGMPAGKEVTFRAVAYDGSAGKGFSNRIYLKISDGSPDMKMKTPLSKTKFLKVDEVMLTSTAIDFDGTVTKVEYFADGTKVGETNDPNGTVTWSNLPVGNIYVWARGTDNENKTGNSDTITVVVSDYRNADEPTEAIPGVRFRYYEGSFSILPDFEGMIMANMGSQPNFTLDRRKRSDNFGFRFNGYIKIETEGAYKFYTRSDDGSKMFFGTELIVNNDGSHGMDETSGRILLKPGYHKYILDYAQGGGGYGLEVYYEGPGIGKTRIPDGVLFREVQDTVCAVAVTGVTLSAETLTVAERNTNYDLKAYVKPVNTCIKDVKLTSGNPAVASIDALGGIVGNSVGTATITVTTIDGGKTATCEVNVVANTLPSPWNFRDVGPVGVAGSATYEDGVFTIVGSGRDIESNNDGFAYVSQPWSGDGNISARVISQTKSDDWAKTGVMFRESGQLDSKFVMVQVTPSNGIGFVWRNDTGGGSDWTNLGPVTLPIYLKLERVGNVFNAYKSSDGGNWTLIATRTVNLKNDLMIGLPVTAHNNGTTSRVKFDEVLVRTNAVVEVTGVTVSPETVSVGVNGKTSLVATVAPVDATNKVVTWASSNTSVATVDSQGKVSAIAEGTATITATTSDGGKTATCEVTVTPQVHVASVIVDPDVLTLEVEETSTLMAVITPEDATIQDVTWSSSNTSVATVDENGVVTAKAIGEATITGTAIDGGITGTSEISVIASPVTGVSLPATLSIVEGGSSTLKPTIAPSNATNKSVTWLSDNTEVASVDANGKVTAHAIGEASITVTTVDGGFTSSCLVSVITASGACVDEQEVITCRKTTGTINIDGDPSESDWCIASVMTKFPGNNTATFGVLHDETYLYIGGKVLDSNLDGSSSFPWENDGFELYLDPDHSRSVTYDSHDRQFIVNYSGSSIWVNTGGTAGASFAYSNIPGGYTLEIAIPWTLLNFTAAPEVGTVIGFDISNDDKDGSVRTQTAWNGDGNNYNNTSKFGDLKIAPAQGCPDQQVSVDCRKAINTIVIDGDPSESDWCVSNSMTKFPGNNTATFGVLYDDTYLYIGGKILDTSLDGSSSFPWENDGFELYVDPDHSRSVTYDSHDRQFIVNYAGSSVWINSGVATGASFAYANATGGYTLEIAIPWALLNFTGAPEPNTIIGFEISNDDKDGSTRTQTLWNGDQNAWNNTSKFGDLVILAPASTTIDVTGVSVDLGTLSLEVGTSALVTATVAPEDATNQNVSWSSDNTAVATVDQTGNVTAVAAGNAVITVTTEDGGKTATVQVTVTPGQVTGIDENSSGVIRLYPNPSNGFEFSITGIIGNAEISITDGSGRSVFTNKYQSTGKITVSGVTLRAGLYVVSIETKDKVVKRKLIIR